MGDGRSCWAASTRHESMTLARDFMFVKRTLEVLYVSQKMIRYSLDVAGLVHASDLE